MTVRLFALLCLAATVLISAEVYAQSDENDPRPVVVMLHQGGSQGAAFGAGIVVSQNAQRTVIATAAHNLYVDGDFYSELGPQSVEVVFYTNRGTRFLARPLAQAIDIDLDLAFISVDNVTGVPRYNETDFAILSEAGASTQTVSLLGQPQGLNWEIFTGARVLQPDMRYFRIQTPSGAVVPGMSGGALLDANQAITGMIVDTEGAVGRAIPIQNIIAITQRFGFESNLVASSLRPDRRIIEETSPPIVQSAHVNSGLLLGMTVSPAKRTQVDLRTYQTNETPLHGQAFAYVVDANGRTFELGGFLEPGRHEIQLPSKPAFIEHCSIVAVPDRSGRYLYTSGRWRVDQRDGRDFADEVKKQVTTNSRICLREAKPIAQMGRPFGPTKTTYLPLRMFHVFAVIPKTATTTLIGLSPWGGEHASETRVDSGEVTFLKSTGGVWKPFFELKEDVYLEGLFSKQNVAIPTNGFLSGTIAACTVRTKNGETFVGLTLFQGSSQANRQLRKSDISPSTTGSEKLNPTRFFHVPGKSPCAEALGYL